MCGRETKDKGKGLVGSQLELTRDRLVDRGNHDKFIKSHGCHKLVHFDDERSLIELRLLTSNHSRKRCEDPNRFMYSTTLH